MDRTLHAWLVIWGAADGTGTWGFDRQTEGGPPPSLETATAEARRRWVQDHGRKLPRITQSIRCASDEELEASLASLP